MFEESEHGMEGDTQKRESDSKNEKKAQEMRKKVMEKFGETKKHKEQDESDTGDQKQSRRCSLEGVGFLRENFEQKSRI